MKGAKAPKRTGKRLDLGEKASHPRLLAGRVIVMNGIVRGGFVDSGSQLLGSLSSCVGVAGGDGVLEALEMRLDGRFVAQVLKTLPLGGTHSLTLLFGVSHPLFLPSSLQSRWSLA